MAIVLGVDLSTQSTTVEVRDADDATLLGVGSAPHPRTHPPVSEHVTGDWWGTFTLALNAGLEQARADRQDVVAVGVAAQCHGLVLLDERGRLLRPVKLWNDTTSAPQAARMVTDASAAWWSDAVGSVPSAAFTISKLAWVADHEAELLERAAAVLLPHDWMTFHLTGQRVTDRSDASGTGYYAAHEQRWRTDVLERWVGTQVDWHDVLPTVLGPDEAAGRIRPVIADELGLPSTVMVSAGGGDQHLGAVGLGLQSGDVAYSLGTSGVVMAVSERPVFDHGGVVDGVANAIGGYLPLACTLNATKVTDWTAEMLGVGVDELGQMALTAAGQNRPSFAVYLDGERTPSRPTATGTLTGLTTATTREDIARAAFEGVVLGLVGAHHAIAACGVDVGGHVYLTGGGAQSAAYRQILAEVLGRPVLVRDVNEATARGAALQAKAVLDGSSLKELSRELRPPLLHRVRPDHRIEPQVIDRYQITADWRGADRSTTVIEEREL